MNPVVSSQQLTLCIHCGGSMFFATPNSIPQKTRSQRTGNPKKREKTNSFSMFRIGEPFLKEIHQAKSIHQHQFGPTIPPMFFWVCDLKLLWLTAPIWLPLLLINLVSKKWSNLLLMNAHQDQHSGVLG